MQSRIEQLNQRHFKILDLCLEGLTNKAISERVGMLQTQVSIVINSPNFQHELALRRERINSHKDKNLAAVGDAAELELHNNARAAAMKLVGGLDSEDERIVNKSANDILDRTGHAKLIRQESKVAAAIVVLNPDDVTRITESLAMEI